MKLLPGESASNKHSTSDYFWCEGWLHTSLAGEEIPSASRILLVTDAFDAMTNDRPYRKAMPVKAAVEELERNSGGQFDPVVVEAFLRILARDGAQPLRSARSAATKQAATARTE